MIIQLPNQTVAPPTPLPETHFRLQTSPLRGHEHYITDDFLHKLTAGDPLTLVAEPANPHDRHAVRVHWHDTHIGYLPRQSNHIVSRLLRQGAPITARIAWLSPNNHPPLTLDILLPKPS